MSLSMRDRVATLLVATAVVVYGLWLAGALGELNAGSVAVIVLGLGFVASASAVVPGFAALLAGSRLYLVVASLGGLIALACGALTVARATEATLAVLVVATIGLWAAATVRHAAAGRTTTVAVG
jgi:hypothetical protein